jgi:hypothetical protein
MSEPRNSEAFEPHIASQPDRACNRDAKGDRSEYTCLSCLTPVQGDQGDQQQRKCDGVRSTKKLESWKAGLSAIATRSLRSMAMN